MQKLIERITPFFILGIFLVLLVVGFMLMIHLLILGAAVGLVLYLIAWIKEKLFPSKDMTVNQSQHKSGRTIDHDDIP